MFFDMNVLQRYPGQNEVMYNRIARLIPEHPRKRANLAVSGFVIGVIFLSSWLIRVGNYVLHPSYVSASAFISFLLGSGFILSSIYLFYTLSEQSNTTDRGTEDEDTASAIDILRKQYATGAITDEEFEHRLNTLLQSEDTDQRDQSEPTPLDNLVDSAASADSPSTAELNTEQSR
ncbi:hypothetical protein HAH_5090 (plasmid) [Haloarcula hispanica ATCC 33960]|uniref:SHOCT domain-containing protein n=1 Tax=Haloarcula hispanica (strain ATCC 33960 / DSM 4426 / JCM 8911 / NBRC 102182 / NCIMB 2187 / VKM B-1755) TaxID=634497 RepID=G0I003_HALHT|nr:hypothetical protein HAH_5090 [Haloarcula hispanica ATCC 33960]